MAGPPPTTLRCDRILFADAANFSQEGKLNLLGEFNMLQTSGPHALLRGRLVARLTGTAGDIGAHQFSIRILDGDGNLVATSPNLDLNIAASTIPGLPPRIVVNLELPSLALSAPGDYVFEVYVDGARQDHTADLHVVRSG